MRRWLCGALSLALAGAARADEVQPKDASGAQARQLQFTVKKVVSLEAHTGKPSFYGDPRPHLVDRGRALYYGRGAFHGPGLVYVVELPKLEERILESPSLEFARSHGELLLNPMVEDMPCLDRTDGRAALVMKDLHKSKAYVAWWDLAKNEITNALLVGEKGRGSWVGVSAVGYVPERGECFVHVERSVGAGFEDAVLAVGKDAVRTVATFNPKFITSHGPWFDPVHQRAMVVEITEVTGAQPTGYLVDLANGGVRSFPIPQLVYGFTFDPDGRTLYAYGVKARELWAINAATGAAVKRVRMGDIGHALGWIGSSLAVVGNVRIHLLDKQTMGHRGVVGTRRIAPEAVNVESSVVLPDGTVALNTFYKLVMTRVER
jgi:hypothetical protein